jgi:hypothetical protein
MMENFILILTAITLMIGTSTITYVSLRYIWRRLPNIAHPRTRAMTAVMSVFAVHFVNIGLYAVAFYGLTHVMAKESLLSFADYYYFASTTYAAMGNSNTVSILSELRLLTALEAVNGIVLIIASVGFIHAVTKRLFLDNTLKETAGRS